MTRTTVKLVETCCRRLLLKKSLCASVEKTKDLAQVDETYTPYLVIARAHTLTLENEEGCVVSQIQIRTSFWHRRVSTVSAVTQRGDRAVYKILASSSIAGESRKMKRRPIHRRILSYNLNL